MYYVVYDWLLQKLEKNFFTPPGQKIFILAFVETVRLPKMASFFSDLAHCAVEDRRVDRSFSRISECAVTHNFFEAF